MTDAAAFESAMSAPPCRRCGESDGMPMLQFADGPVCLCCYARDVAAACAVADALNAGLACRRAWWLGFAWGLALGIVTLVAAAALGR